MAPGSDFYKTLSLELSSQQIAVDLFSFSSQFIDLATMCEHVHEQLHVYMNSHVHRAPFSHTCIERSKKVAKSKE